MCSTSLSFGDLKRRAPQRFSRKLLAACVLLSGCIYDPVLVLPDGGSVNTAGVPVARGTSGIGGSTGTGGASVVGGAASGGAGGLTGVGGVISGTGSGSTGGSSTICGDKNCACDGNYTCNWGLTCVSNICVPKLIAKAVTGGGQHTCALLSDSAIRCWGDNEYSQLGNSAKISFSPVPVIVPGITNAAAVAAGGQHTCALLTGGTVRCWGDNSYGQLGNGTTTTSSVPVAVSGMTNAATVAAGGQHTCALLSGGAVQCWGDNEYGQLGDGTTTNSSAPVTVSGMTNATAVSTGYYHTCALLNDGPYDAGDAGSDGGTLRCWGQNHNRQLGDNTNASYRSESVKVWGISNATTVAAGQMQNCALLSDGTVQCWGLVSPISPEPSPVPVPVSGIADVTDVVPGGSHICALLSDSTVQCWGFNQDGQLGVGSIGPPSCLYSLPCSPTPVPVLGITNAAAVSPGYIHTCAVLSGGIVQCWGDNENGQLGNGTTTNSSVPVTVSGF